jgi:endonuclease YncB( thermonuclease family)
MCYKRLSSWMKLLFLFIILNSVNVHAETLTGKVVSVADGDTITVLDASNTQHKIRLSGIDAPEKRQAFGTVSKQYLANMVFNKSVIVSWQKNDRYGRIIGKVLVDDIDVNLEQIKAGMAWFYRQYQKQQPIQDQADYAAAEQEAKANKLGLWVDEDPIAPWNFRRAKRNVSP